VKPTLRQYREAAKRLHHDEGTCEVDDNAPVSRAVGNPDKGAYVQAWVWVYDVDAMFPDSAERTK
jgi:hypothetical protein